MRSYEQSHMRLGMNRIDLLIIHDLDFWFHATEAKVAAYLGQLFTSGWRALEQLRKHGLIRGDRRRHQRARHDAALPRHCSGLISSSSRCAIR